jgi:hypothetical protein
MTLLRMFLLSVVLVAPSASAGRLTDAEARDLPLAELSQRALGEAGKLMIDMDRPRDGKLAWGSLRFYGRGVVTGSQFGICGSDWVTLHFDEDGELVSIDAQRRYGVEESVYRSGKNWTYEESDAICSGVKSTRAYFPAPDPEAALAVVRFVDAIQGRGPFAKQDFEFQCTGICNRGRGLLSELQLDEIDDVRTLDGSVLWDRKWRLEVVVGEGEVGPFPKKFRIDGSTYMNKVVISRVSVDVGSTLE